LTVSCAAAVEAQKATAAARLVNSEAEDCMCFPVVRHRGAGTGAFVLFFVVTTRRQNLENR
jgi:hypothetical protein